MKVGQQKFTKGVSYPVLVFTASQIGAHFLNAGFIVSLFLVWLGLPNMLDVK